MTTNDIDAIEARANAATPGPWVQADFGSLEWETDIFGMVFAARTERIPRGLRKFVEDMPVSVRACKTETIPDAVFIAAARQDVPALCAEVRELRAALERARALAGQMQVYAEGMDDELNSFGVVIVATIRAFGDKLAAALGEGGRP